MLHASSQKRYGSRANERPGPQARIISMGSRARVIGRVSQAEAKVIGRDPQAKSEGHRQGVIREARGRHKSKEGIIRASPRAWRNSGMFGQSGGKSGSAFQKEATQRKQEELRDKRQRLRCR